MSKKTPVDTLILRSTLFDDNEPLLDLDFDDLDEVLLFEPPVHCIRDTYHRLTWLDKDPEDNTEE